MSLSAHNNLSLSTDPGKPSLLVYLTIKITRVVNTTVFIPLILISQFHQLESRRKTCIYFSETTYFDCKFVSVYFTKKLT